MVSLANRMSSRGLPLGQRGEGKNPPLRVLRGPPLRQDSFIIGTPSRNPSAINCCITLTGTMAAIVASAAVVAPRVAAPKARATRALRATSFTGARVAVAPKVRPFAITAPETITGEITKKTKEDAPCGGSCSRQLPPRAPTPPSLRGDRPTDAPPFGSRRAMLATTASSPFPPRHGRARAGGRRSGV